MKHEVLLAILLRKGDIVYINRQKHTVLSRKAFGDKVKLLTSRGGLLHIKMYDQFHTFRAVT